MTNMRGITPLLTTICLLFLATGFTSCEEGKDSVSKPTNKSNLEIAKDVSEEIMGAFINKDEEALYSLFSDSAKNSSLLKSQIQEVFDFIDGEIISYNLSNSTGGGKSTEKGKVTAQNMTPHISNVITNTEKNTTLFFNIF